MSTILDNFSRYIIAWKLCTTMAVCDVTETLQLALTVSGCHRAHIRRRPRLSDNGPSDIAADLASWLETARSSTFVARLAIRKPRAGSLQNRLPLGDYYMAGDLETQVGAFVEHYNHRQYHESLNNPHAS